MPPDLSECYDAHADALFAFVLNLTQREADARDIVQEVFLKIAARPELLSEVREPRGFLLRLAHRQAIDSHRRRTTRQAVHERAASEPAALFIAAPDADEQGFREALAAALAQLPAEQRTVAHLKLWEEMTFAEIAAALDIPPNTAASRYRYAMDKLQAQLRPLYEELQ